MTELFDEFENDGMRLEAVARLARVNFSTVYRWVVKGLPAPGGEGRIRLQALRIGRRWWTSRPAFSRFCAATTPPLDGDAVEPPRTATQRRRASERAAKRLAQLGI
jgi:hypothetical protein